MQPTPSLNASIPIQALHGFLGLPTDWHEIIDTKSSNQWNFHSVWQLQEDFCTVKNAGGILLGYSLGGRLALRILSERLVQWKGAVIISSHPGLESSFEKEKRILHDRQWAKRFLEEPWESLIHEWENQAVFRFCKNRPERQEKQFERQRLAQILEKYSLGHQPCYKQMIAACPIPILWLTGEHDTAYTAIAQDLTFAHPLSKHIVVKDAGHRLPWDQPERFQELVNHFIKKIEEET